MNTNHSNDNKSNDNVTKKNLVVCNSLVRPDQLKEIDDRKYSLRVSRGVIIRTALDEYFCNHPIKGG